jgi:AhpC/TSA family
MGPVYSLTSWTRKGTLEARHDGGVMKQRSRLALLGLWLLAGALGVPRAGAQGSKAQPEALQLKVGDTAPDFKLQYFDGSNLKDVSLSEYRGKSNVVLAFYIFAFTGG